MVLPPLLFRLAERPGEAVRVPVAVEVGEQQHVGVKGQILGSREAAVRPLQEHMFSVEHDVEPPVPVQVDKHGASALDLFQAGLLRDVGEIRGEKKQEDVKHGNRDDKGMRLLLLASILLLACASRRPPPLPEEEEGDLYEAGVAEQKADWPKVREELEREALLHPNDDAVALRLAEVLLRAYGEEPQARLVYGRLLRTSRAQALHGLGGCDARQPKLIG